MRISTSPTDNEVVVLEIEGAIDAHTARELDRALKEVREYQESFSILDVHLDPADRSLALQRLTDALGKRVKGG